MEQTMIKEKQSRTIEWLIFMAYAVLLIVISYFHEPWYDEAEAWQMARGASIHDLLFYIPHYEGHPSLWYLILAVPAKLGVPYELGLKSIACFFAILYGWLLVFCSPFPKVIKFSLPFQYFFFYQYGIIARPYGLLILLFCLLAMAYKTRNEHPFRFVLPMILLCTLDGYGIVLSGGIAVAWLWEILREKIRSGKLGTVWLDKRVWSLLVLLILAILVILQIMPREDTYSTMQNSSNNSILFRLIYMFFVALPDCSVLTVLGCSVYLSKVTIGIPMLLVGVLLGLILLFMIQCCSDGKNLLYFWIPYLFFGIFSSVVYICAHHIGILLVFTIFWLWIAWEVPGRFAVLGWFWQRVKISEQDQKTLIKIGHLIIYLCIGVSLYWTIGTSALEIGQPYYYGKEVAEFLKTTGLDQTTIMAEYDVFLPTDSVENVYEYVNTELVAEPVAILPYYDENICRNLNMGSKEKGYALHRMPNAEENRRVMEEWKSMGAPDVILGPMRLDLLFGDEVQMNDYVPVYEFNPYVGFWKAVPFVYNIIYKDYVYLRRDLLEQYGLQEIPKNGEERF